MAWSAARHRPSLPPPVARRRVGAGVADACGILAGMESASVILDIPTQALDAPYTYLVPDALRAEGRPVEVGCAVLVPFGHRKAVGFIVGLEDVEDEVPAADEGPASGEPGEAGDPWAGTLWGAGDASS